VTELNAIELLDEHFGWEFVDSLAERGITLKRKTIYVNGKKITVENVIYYYAHDARNMTSGCRSLGELAGDWRPIDRLAKECLEIYKVLKRDQLVREAKKHGMTPKGW